MPYQPRQPLRSLPPTSSIFDASGLSTHPLDVYPTAASLARILPPFSDCERIVSHTLDWTGWLHGSVHAPTFRAEVHEFWAAPAETRLEHANPAWLALFFAQLCCGLRHSTRAQLQQLGPSGLSDEDVQVLSQAHFEAALSCLYRSHFLDNRQLHAVQAIAVLVIGCQDGAFSNVFPSLLSLGIAMAQDLGFHRLPTDEAWAESVAGEPLDQRVRSLIAFETKKRVFWALTSEDWFSVRPCYHVKTRRWSKNRAPRRSTIGGCRRCSRRKSRPRCHQTRTTSEVPVLAKRETGKHRTN